MTDAPAYFASVRKLILITPILFGTFLFCPKKLYAQSTTVDLEYRFQPSYSRGFRQPLYDGERAGFFTQQRTRLILNYINPDSLKAQIILQDRRAWGDVSDRQDIAEVAIFRAWVEKPFGQNFSLKLGRQGLIYDDQNVFGGLDWAGTLAHDLALGKYEKGTFKAHLGLAFNANRNNELKRELFQQNFYKTLQFLYLNKKWDKVKSTFWFINQGLEKADTTVAYTQTFGTNTTISLGQKTSFKGIYLQQVGKDASNRKVNAHFLSARVQFKTSNTTTIGIGLDKMSGSDLQELQDPNAKSNSYDNLFGLRHGRFGWIDYFYLLIEPIAGLQDYYLKYETSPSQKLNIKNHIHYFRTDNNSYHFVRPFGFVSPLDPFLGVENDLLITYKFTEDFKASFGHSIMFGTNTLDEMFGGQKSRDNQFFYAVIIASPRLFESKSD